MKLFSKSKDTINESNSQLKDRCYTFLAADWLTPDEIQELNRKDDAANAT